MPETIELLNPVLGLQPYVLIEADVDEDDDLALNIRAGGGVDTKERMLSVLLMVVEELTGVPTDLYVQQVDAARQAAGLPSLVEASE